MEEMAPGRGFRRWLIMFLLAGALVVAPAQAKPAKTVPAANLKTFTYGSGPTANPYLVWTPKSYYRKRQAPLLIMLHGCQTSAAQQMHSNLYNRLAGQNGFVVAYPDVDSLDAAMPGPLRNCWGFYNPANWHRDQGEAAAIAGITREIMQRRRIDPQRVYLMGMSAGSFMTSIMAAAYPDLYAAVGINAGGAYTDFSCIGANSPMSAETSASLAREEMGPRARIVPRLVMGGDADQGIPPACADKALEQGLRTDNLVLGSSQETPISLQPAGSREVAAATAGGYSSTVSNYKDPNGCLIGQRWLIHGMNHFWPGGTSDERFKNFTDPKGPNGAEISWNFFKRFTKRGTAMPCATR